MLKPIKSRWRLNRWKKTREKRIFREDTRRLWLLKLNWSKSNRTKWMLSERRLKPTWMKDSSKENTSTTSKSKEFLPFVRLLQRYQNVKKELENQQNIERTKLEKQYNNRPSTAMSRSNMNMSKMGSSRMGGKISASKNLPASKPSYQWKRLNSSFPDIKGEAFS